MREAGIPLLVLVTMHLTLKSCLFLSSRIKLTNRKAVAELVEKSIFNNLDLPDEIFNSIDKKIDDFIGRKISYIGEKTNFFNIIF